MKFRLPIVLEKEIINKRNNNFNAIKHLAGVLLYFCGIIFVFHFLRFFFLNGFDSVHLGQYDWDQHFFYLESSLKPIRDFGVFPFWNPYYVGGIGILENPQIKFFSPTFFLVSFSELYLD